MKKIVFFLFMLACLHKQATAQSAYLEFKMTGTQPGTTGTTKVYTRDGSVRSEIDIPSPQMPGGGIHQVSLTLRDHPDKIFLLNEKAKAYTEMNVTTTSAAEADPGQYQVTIVGREKVNGYSSAHVKVRKTGVASDQDMWLSAELPGYQQYKNVKSKYTTEGLFKALSAKGVEGFPVRVLVHEYGRAVQLDLVKAELRINEPALFNLVGYTRQVSGAPAGSPTDVQDMARKLQSMTPEERQQFIDQIRKRQQANPAFTPTPPH